MFGGCDRCPAITQNDPNIKIAFDHSIGDSLPFYRGKASISSTADKATIKTVIDQVSVLEIYGGDLYARPQILQIKKVEKMTLSDAVRQFIVCLRALRLPQECMDMHLRVLQHILWFYGKNKDLAAFDESTVLQYVKLFDPFDCAQPNQERGEVFCSFTHWMMVNRLIPAWSNQQDNFVEWQDIDEHKIPGDCIG